jgi:Ca-activated chloride channel family protein
MKNLLTLICALVLLGCGTTAPVSAQRVTVVEPGGGSWLGGAPVRTRIRVGADGQTYVGVWVEAPSLPARRARPPMAVSLVVDTSGSMSGDKIENARLAAASLIQRLAPGDLVSIYGFSNEVSQIAPPTVVSHANRGRLLSRLSDLYPHGSTNLYGGLQQGVMRMGEAPSTHPLRRVFLISDGIANVGPTDHGTLGTLAGQSTEWGTQITAIGVGYDYDQPLLSTLAVRSSGRLYHLARPQQMAGILEEELGLLSQSVALSAVLRIRPAPGVVILEPATLGARLEDGHLVMPLGALYAGQRREVLFRVQAPTAAVGTRQLVAAELAYREPGTDARRSQEAAVAYGVVSRAAAEETSPRVETMVASYRASRLQLEAAEAIRRGDGARATAALRGAEQVLDEALPSASPARAREITERRRRIRGVRVQTEAAGGAAPAGADMLMADDAMEAEGY